MIAALLAAVLRLFAGALFYLHLKLYELQVITVERKIKGLLFVFCFHESKRYIVPLVFDFLTQQRDRKPIY